jgi:hypothetical protein
MEKRIYLSGFHTELNIGKKQKLGSISSENQEDTGGLSFSPRFDFSRIRYKYIVHLLNISIKKIILK